MVNTLYFIWCLVRKTIWELVRLPTFESSFSVNHHIQDFINDISTFCLDITAKLQFLN